MSGHAVTPAVATLIALLLCGIGVLMNMQSVSLASGTNVLWFGVGLAAIGVVLGFVLKAKNIALAIAMLLLVFCVANSISAEHSLNQKRQEIQDIFNN
jgi:hypothetical protein